MAGISLAYAEERLTAYLDAERKILLGQVVEVDGKRLTRADLKNVQTGIAVWEARVQRLSAGGGLRVREVIPR